MKGVSPLVAVLFLIGVSIASVIIYYGYIQDLFSKATPKSVDLSISGISAEYSDGTLVLRVIVVPSGSEDIRIEGLEIYRGGNPIRYSIVKAPPPTCLKHGSPSELVYLLNNVPDLKGEQIAIRLSWTSCVSNTDGVTWYTTTVS